MTGVKDEKRGERLAVRYSGWDGSVDELLTKTKALGVPNLWLPARSDFYKVERDSSSRDRQAGPEARQRAGGAARASQEIAAPRMRPAGEAYPAGRVRRLLAAFASLLLLGITFTRGSWVRRPTILLPWIRSRTTTCLSSRKRAARGGDPKAHIRNSRYVLARKGGGAGRRARRELAGQIRRARLRPRAEPAGRDVSRRTFRVARRREGQELADQSRGTGACRGGAQSGAPRRRRGVSGLSGGATLA